MELKLDHMKNKVFALLKQSVPQDKHGATAKPQGREAGNGKAQICDSDYSLNALPNWRELIDLQIEC